MKRWLLLLIPLFLTACTHDLNKNELVEIDLIQVMSVDKTEEGYTLSLLYNTMGDADPESGSEGAVVIVKGEGQTVYEAFEDAKLKNKKEISIAHTGFFLIGDGAARSGIHGFIDFLSRDETIKMNALIYFVKDAVAYEFLEEGLENNKQINYDLNAINQKQMDLVTRSDNTLVNMINSIRKEDYSSLLIPYILPEEDDFKIEGYGVVSQNKLVDYLDYDTSSGIDFIKNIIRSYPIYLDELVGLSISYNETELTSVLSEEEIKVKIEVNFETTIKEVLTKEDIFTLDRLNELTKLQNSYILTIIEKPILYSKTTGLDILDMARLVENQHVKEWGNYEGNWKDYIKDIEYEVATNSKITKSFIIGNEVKQ